jgi:hypothetical protein
MHLANGELTRVQSHPRANVALVTCAQLPELDADTQRLIPPLQGLGVIATAVVWDDACVDWSSFDLVVVRSCWDYTQRRSEFIDWCRSVPRLANPAEVVAWNSDKHYLCGLAAAGVSTVPTTWIEPDESVLLPSSGEWVIKPAVSLASLDTGRYRLAEPAHRGLAQAHVARLQAAGRAVMLQRYVDSVDSLGESSLVFIDGVYSHAIRKAAVLHGPDDGCDRRFLPSGGQDLRSHSPTEAEFAVARQALTCGPGAKRPLLYARIDLVTGHGGAPMLMELELVEPQLYLATPSAVDRFAAAIALQSLPDEHCRRIVPRRHEKPLTFS